MNKNEEKKVEANELTEDNLNEVSGGQMSPHRVGGIVSANQIVQNNDGTWSAKVKKDGKYQYINIGNQSDYRSAQSYARENLW